jgi:hypothetical protein
VHNPLWREGVRTVGDLVVALARGEVAQVRNLGPVALGEIRAALVASGIVDEGQPERGLAEPAGVLAWVVREYYGDDAHAALSDLARLAGPTERHAVRVGRCGRDGA